MLRNSSLLSTERRLTTIFVGWAFLFLVVFESIFIWGRLYTEWLYQKQDFEADVHAITHRTPTDKGRKPIIGMNALITNASGTIIDIRGPITREDGEWLVDLSIMATVGTDITLEKNGVMMRKVGNTTNDTFTIFFRKSGYPIDDIIRDILRFLALDILILIPFYLMGRYFVRETLSPVDDNLDSMQHFIHDAGHELKTPLAIVSGNLQIMRDTQKLTDPSLVEDSISAISLMASNLDWLLELTQIARTPTVTHTPLSLAITEELSRYSESIEKKHITVEKHIRAKSSLPIDRKHFSLLFGNLLKNAITYNTDHGSITLRADEKGFSISDTGVGISADEKEKIWERFYRGEGASRTHGSGIGLSIVERIVKIYWWKVQLDSTPWEWTTFRIEIT